MLCLPMKQVDLYLQLQTLFQAVKYKISLPCHLPIKFLHTLFLDIVLTSFLLQFSSLSLSPLCLCVHFPIHPSSYPTSSPVTLSWITWTLSSLLTSLLAGLLELQYLHHFSHSTVHLSLKIGTRCTLSMIQSHWVWRCLFTGVSRVWSQAFLWNQVDFCMRLVHRHCTAIPSRCRE